VTPTEIATLTKALGPVIREFAAKENAALRAENAALVARVTALESQKALVPRDGRDGVTMAEMAPLLAAEVHKAVAALPKPKDGDPGKDAQPLDFDEVVEHVLALVPKPKDGDKGDKGDPGTNASAPDLDTIVSRVLALVPKPEKGDPGLDGHDADAPDVDAIVARVVAAIPKPKDGQDGKSIDVEAVVSRVYSMVSKDVGLIPVPKDGEDGVSVTVDDVMPLIVREIERRVAAVPLPKDGTGFTSALIDRAGHLVLTLSDGTTQNVGAVVGKDVDPADVERAIHAQLATWPKPKDGQDGHDGLGFDDYDVYLDETRGLVLRLCQGERVKEFVLPSTFYTGDWEPGKEYPPGASFAFDGHTWVVKQKNSAKPEQGSPLWWISSRRGKQGKEGKKGDPGTNGRDLTQMDPQTGRKW
jgi:integrin beta 3